MAVGPLQYMNVEAEGAAAGQEQRGAADQTKDGGTPDIYPTKILNGNHHRLLLY